VGRYPMVMFIETLTLIDGNVAPKFGAGGGAVGGGKF